ncbi:MAG: ATP-binding protein [Atopobiaceae bacterium]|nr:ATP-binding protein [Atopobiaceae bacterium]
MAEDSSLLGFVSSLSGGDPLRVEENLGDGYVRLRVLEAERRQAKHDIRCVEDVLIELLRNARDAGARKVLVASAREGALRTLVVLDDGCGIPEEMQERVFDARVTSKLDSVHMDRWGVHGRGMALFSIRENAESAEVLASAPGRGTAVRVVCDTGSLPERADQSTWPRLSSHAHGAGAESLGRGPHNLVRTCCEFGLESEGACRVYVGSPAQVVSTVVARCAAGAASDATGALRAPTLLEELAASPGAAALAEAAGRLGLRMSERNALRILSGEVAPLANVCATLRASRDGRREPASARAGAGLGRPVGLSREDSESLARSVTRDVRALGERYYFRPCGEARVSVRDGLLQITVPIADDE